MPYNVGKITNIYSFYPRVNNDQILKVLKTKNPHQLFSRWWVQQNPKTTFGKGLKNPKTWFWEITHYPQDYTDVHYTWIRRRIKVIKPYVWKWV